MVEQMINGYLVVIRTADELGGFPITGKKDAGIIEIYNAHADNEDLVDSAWITISKNGTARLERIK